MSNLPYQAIAVISLVCAFVFGAAFTSGVEFMRANAEQRGRITLMLEMSPAALTEISASRI